MSPKKLEEEKQLFYAYLRRNGMKRTHQKDLILQVFLSNEGHLSVDDIYGLVRKKDKKIGIVTVFRTLKSLKECGIAKEISLGDGLTRFEHCYRHPLHHHLVCTSCQKVIEFLSPLLERVHDAIIDRHDFTLVRQRVQIEGICRECRDQIPAQSAAKLDTDKLFARDALRLALEVNKLLLDFYHAGAQSNKHPAGRAAFQEFEKTELAHTESLSRELQLLHEQEKGLEQAPEMLFFERQDLRDLVPSANVFAGEPNFDETGVHQIAGQLEAKFACFFKEYAERFGDCNGRAIFQRLALQRKFEASV